VTWRLLNNTKGEGYSLLQLITSFLGKNGMKKDRKQELEKKTPEQLSDMVRDARNSLAQLRFDLRAGKTSNVKDIRVLRNELAVLLTLLHQHG